MNTGGAEVMLMDIFRNISKNTKFSFLVNYKKKQGIVKGDFDDEILQKGATLKHIPTQWDIGPIKYIKEFKRIYNELGKPEVVHIHLNAKSGIIAYAAKQAGAKKIIVHSHANIVYRGKPVKVKIYQLEMFFQKWLINKYATDYWGASEEANRSLFYKNKLKKSIVINNAVNTEKFQSVTKKQVEDFKNILGINNDTLVLGNVGRIVKHKNIGFIIDVLYEFKKTHTDFVFLVAGRIDDKEYYNEIQTKIEQYNLQDKVLFLGNRSDIPLIMNTLDIFVSPALQEGFGLVAIEAQAAGTPCVLYKGFPKIVDMELGLISFLKTFEVNKWTNEIISLLKSNKKTINSTLIKQRIIEKGFDVKNNSNIIEQKYHNF